MRITKLQTVAVVKISLLLCTRTPDDTRELLGHLLDLVPGIGGVVRLRLDHLHEVSVAAGAEPFCCQGLNTAV